MKENATYRPHKADFILTGFLVLLSVGAFIPLKQWQRTAGDRALLYENGQFIKEISLKKDEILTYKNMEFAVEDGSIRVTRTDCPHKVCMHEGKIRQAGQTLVCVPNKIMVEIVTDSNQDDYQVVSY